MAIRSRGLTAVLIAFGLIGPSSAFAAEVCEGAIERAELQTGIPTGLLLAIGRVEAGRPKGGKQIVWPWAINVDGTGEFYETRQNALDAVRQHLKDGARQIDIGCLQINITHWHPVRELNLKTLGKSMAFQTLAEAMDPSENALYAAKLVMRLHREAGDWTNAVARYHSRRYRRMVGYVCRVSRALAKIRPDLGPPAKRCRG